MTKKQIITEAIRIADKAGLYGVKRFEYLTRIHNSELHKNVPETEPTLQEQLKTAMQGVIDQCNSSEGFFSNHNQKKK